MSWNLWERKEQEIRENTWKPSALDGNWSHEGENGVTQGCIKSVEEGKERSLGDFSYLRDKKRKRTSQRRGRKIKKSIVSGIKRKRTNEARSVQVVQNAKENSSKIKAENGPSELAVERILFLTVGPV